MGEAARFWWPARLEDRPCSGAGFGRSFNYYDGFLFEVRSPSSSQADDAPVAAGGRYDGLPANWAARFPASAARCAGPGLGRRGGPDERRAADVRALFQRRLEQVVEISWPTAARRSRPRAATAAMWRQSESCPGSGSCCSGGRHRPGPRHRRLRASAARTLREREAADTHVLLLRALGFGPADLVVAAPASWIDVDHGRPRGGRLRLRGAHRPPHAGRDEVRCRRAAAAHGVVDYRTRRRRSAARQPPPD